MYPSLNESRAHYDPNVAPIYKMVMEEPRWEVAFLASSWLIPRFHADFPGFTSKIVEYSRYLLAMAHWASLRTQELSQLFHWKRAQMPHYSTWSRVLAHAVDPVEVERIVGGFFAAASARATRQQANLHVALDGKTVRGTIPLRQSTGVHLLTAYQPEQGVMLTQMNVQGKGHELTYAPTMLRQLDLRGVVVSGDAMFARAQLEPASGASQG